MITLLTLFYFTIVGQDRQEVQDAQNGKIDWWGAALGWNMVVEFFVEFLLIIGKIIKLSIKRKKG